MKSFLKKLNYFDFIFMALLAMIITFVFVFNMNIFPRIWLSLKSLLMNFWYYLGNIVVEMEKPDQVLDMVVASTDGSLRSILPLDLYVFLAKIPLFFSLLFQPGNVAIVLNIFLDFLTSFLQFAQIFVLFIPIFYFKFDNYFAESGKKGKSKQLKRYLRFQERVLMPSINYIKYVVSYFFQSKFFFWSFVISFGFIAGFITLPIDALSWFFYFFSSLDLTSIYKFLAQFTIDNYVFLTSVPVIVYLALGYWLFDRIRLKIAYGKLNHFENYNKGFIRSLGISTFLQGTMGSGKTKLQTDMRLSTEEMFRTDAFKIIQDVDNLFSEFPFRKLEVIIADNVEKDLFKNRIHVRDYVKSMKDAFFEEAAKEHPDTVAMENALLGYKFLEFGLERDVGNNIENLFDCLSDYAEAFYMYNASYALSTGNYPVRHDGIRADIGFFPLWDYDYFHRSARQSLEATNMSKNIDYDAMRLGKKFVENNPNSFVLDGCVIGLAEIGKERGNQYLINELELKDKKTNQKNDFFNAWVKMVRHLTTVRHRTFIKLFMDDQRSESTGADLRQLCESIVELSPDKEEGLITLPLFWLEPIFINKMIDKRNSWFYRYRFFREDETLLFYLINKVVDFFSLYLLRRSNIFSYSIYNLSLLGSRSLEVENKQKYYIMNKKIYSKRYKSDSHSAFFEENMRKSPRGFKHLHTFDSVNASLVELEAANSYFISDIVAMMKKINEEKVDDDALVI